MNAVTTRAYPPLRSVTVTNERARRPTRRPATGACRLLMAMREARSRSYLRGITKPNQTGTAAVANLTTEMLLSRTVGRVDKDSFGNPPLGHRKKYSRSMREES